MIKTTDARVVRGKTFSLFGNHSTTSVYYKKVVELTEILLAEYNNADQLISVLRMSERRRLFRRNPELTEKRKKILQIAEPVLGEFLTDVDTHLKSLSRLTNWDKEVWTTKSQYFAYMIEIELINQMNITCFRSSDYKLAFLPHCLRDLSKDCQASAEDNIDYVCRRCSKNCYIRKVSDFLKDQGVKPFIWRKARLRRLFRRLLREGKMLAVLGIACIPELLKGMRLCHRAKIPVVGIPLNANRCARWMGEFHDNSVDLEALERLVKN